MALTCYMCDEKATTKEHVPPRCFFPKKTESLDLRKQLITVPSCEDHNSSKAKDDEYLHCLLSMTVQESLPFHKVIVSKLLRTFKRSPGVKALFNTRQPVLALDPDTKLILPTEAVRIDMARFNKFIDHLARAVYFHHFGQKYTEKLIIYPDFLLYLRPEHRDLDKSILASGKILRAAFRGSKSYGENSSVFRYQLERSESRKGLAMRLQFYSNQSVWVVFSECSSGTTGRA